MSAPRVSWVLLWLTVLWVVLWGSITFANVADGVAVALLVLVFARQPRRVARSGRVNPLAFVGLLGYAAYKLVQSNLVIAWEVLTPRNRIHTGVIAIPLRTESAVANVTVANLITLTPGTLTVELDTAPAVVFVNVLHLHDAEAVRRDVHRLEELAIRAFGSSEERDALRRASTEPTDVAGTGTPEPTPDHPGDEDPT